MRLVHFSATPVTDVLFVDQPVLRPRDFGPKPKGLWVSDEDDYGWRQWCEDENFGTERLAYEHEVTLADDARLMVIQTADALDDFTRLYGAPVEKTFRPPGHEDRYYWIDWPAVARKFQGVLITPYMYERRMTNHTSWYYPWDCASGCIWDPAAIADIRVVSPAGAS